MPRGWSMVVLIGVVVLLFAAPKLPQFARSLGQALRIFKAEVQEMQKDSDSAETSKQTLPSLKKTSGIQDSAVTSDVSD